MNPFPYSFIGHKPLSNTPLSYHVFKPHSLTSSPFSNKLPLSDKLPLSYYLSSLAGSPLRL